MARDLLGSFSSAAYEATDTYFRWLVQPCRAEQENAGTTSGGGPGAQRGTCPASFLLVSSLPRPAVLTNTFVFPDLLFSPRT